MTDLEKFTTRSLLAELGRRDVIASVEIKKRITPVAIAEMPASSKRDMTAKMAIATEIAKFLVHGAGAALMEATKYTDEKGELYEVALAIVRPPPEVIGVVQ